MIILTTRNEDILRGIYMNENPTLATELIHEIKAQSKRWFIAFIVVLILWFSTIGVFFWYVSLPIDETTVDIENDDGNANYIGKNMYGVINNGEDNSEP